MRLVVWPGLSLGWSARHDFLSNSASTLSFLFFFFLLLVCYFVFFAFLPRLALCASGVFAEGRERRAEPTGAAAVSAFGARHSPDRHPNVHRAASSDLG